MTISNEFRDAIRSDRFQDIRQQGLDAQRDARCWRLSSYITSYLSIILALATLVLSCVSALYEDYALLIICAVSNVVHSFAIRCIDYADQQQRERQKDLRELDDALRISVGPPVQSIDIQNGQVLLTPGEDSVTV